MAPIDSFELMMHARKSDIYGLTCLPLQTLSLEMQDLH